MRTLSLPASRLDVSQLLIVYLEFFYLIFNTNLAPPHLLTVYDCIKVFLSKSRPRRIYLKEL